MNWISAIAQAAVAIGTAIYKAVKSKKAPPVRNPDPPSWAGIDEREDSDLAKKVAPK